MGEGRRDLGIAQEVGEQELILHARVMALTLHWLAFWSWSDPRTIMTSNVLVYVIYMESSHHILKVMP